MSEYLTIIISAYIFVVALGYWLDYLNLTYMKKYGSVIPAEFEGQIDQELLTKTRDYNVEHTKFGFLSSAVNNIIFLLFIFVFLNIYNSWLISFNMSFVFSGLIFFLLLTYADSLIAMPFSWHNTFKIENKYGFNTMTPQLWITDTVKSLIITTVLLGLLISVGLFIIQKSPALWWFWVWCFFLLFGIFIMYISPYVIEPLFHKFSPLEDKNLENELRELLDKAGLKVSRVFKVDASKRTKHTNAYFTGIGKVKRIVLYDTLLEKMDGNEILSVLAHEAGHWKKKHLLKHLVATETIALIALYVSHQVLQGEFLTELFQIEQSSFFAKVVVLGFLGSIISVPFSPLSHYFSRKHENEADKFSYELTGNSESMISALVKLSKDNLSNLHPHPLYALFHYSHPPVLERIRSIRHLSK